MTSQERIALALSHQEADRVALQDSPWGTTIERWHREGLPADVGPDQYFGYELTGVGFDNTMRLPAETVEETEEYIIQRDALGALSKNWKHATSTPERIDFTVTSRALWEEYKPRLAWSADRVDLDAARQAEKTAREQGKWFYFSSAFGYDYLQAMVGSERLLVALATEPEWAQDMFDTIGQLACTGLEAMLGAGIQFDGCFMFDDLGYRNATLFSPAMFRRYEFPSQRRFYRLALSHGLPSILHSCGRVTEHLPALIEAGLTCIQPLEVKAGMDLIELKQQFGEVLCFMGGIDVRKMAHPDPALIEEEIATKVTCAKQGGGYIYHSDHSVPDNVSFERYCRVMELVKKYGSYE